MTICALNEVKGICDYVKKCKYCKSQIEADAKVCPYCARDLRWGNNPIFLIPIIAIIVVFLYFFLSPNAPLEVKKVVCGLGWRDDTRYCSYFIWEE